MSEETKPSGGGQQARQNQPTGRKRLAPVAVRLATANCQTVYLAALKMQVRGDYSYTRLMTRPGGCRSAGPLTQMPDVPGQLLSVNPSRDGVNLRITDPLDDDPQRLDRLNAVMNQAASTRPAGGAKYVPVEASEHQLSPDNMKLLMLELHRRQEAGELLVIDGEMPSLEEIHGLAGRELYDPNNTSAIKPRYKEDAQAWQEKLAQQQY